MISPLQNAVSTQNIVGKIMYEYIRTYVNRRVAVDSRHKIYDDDDDDDDRLSHRIIIYVPIIIVLCFTIR